jgi:hypothetical protein
MIENPFLLDPGYEGMLETSAFRRRVYDKLSGLKLAPVVPIFLFMHIPTVVTLILGFTVESRTFIGAGIWAGAVTGMFGIFGIVWLCDAPKRRRIYRLAWEGELVIGRLIACARKCYRGDIYKVEVQYEAATPEGKQIRGTQALERDDLLNEPLPPPGTPVLVLVLDETLYFML